MQSPLEENSKVLEKIGLFTVLFTQIDTRLYIEFYFIINQTDAKKRPVLDFLSSQDFKKKLDMLRIILGEDLYLKMNELNKFRNFISHGLYGKQIGSEELSISKLKRGGGKYDSIPLSEEILDVHIKGEREVLGLLHKLILKRIPNIKKEQAQ